MACTPEEALRNIGKLTRALDEKIYDPELVCGLYSMGFPSDFKLGVDEDESGKPHISIKYYCLEERFRRWCQVNGIREIPYEKCEVERVERPIERIWDRRW
jgi:hypothetical protein